MCTYIPLPALNATKTGRISLKYQWMVLYRIRSQFGDYIRKGDQIGREFKF